MNRMVEPNLSCELGRYAPSGIRTRATTLKGWRPGPLVDGGPRARVLRRIGVLTICDAAFDVPPAELPSASPLASTADAEAEWVGADARGHRQPPALAPPSTAAAEPGARAARSGGRERRSARGAAVPRAVRVLARPAAPRRAPDRSLGGGKR